MNVLKIFDGCLEIFDAFLAIFDGCPRDILMAVPEIFERSPGDI